MSITTLSQTNIGSVFGMEISFGETFKVINGKITLPRGYENLDTDISLGIALCLKGLANNDFVPQNDFLNEFEKKEILFISKLIFGAKVSNKKNILYNPKQYTDTFWSYLLKKLKTSFTPLNTFLAEIIENFDSLPSELESIFNVISSVYLVFKKTHNHNSSSSQTTDGANNDGSASIDELEQQDINSGEQCEGQDNGVFAYFNPKLNSEFYFAGETFEDFDFAKKRFVKPNGMKNKVEVFPNFGESIISTMTYTANNINKSYSLFLPNGYSIIDFDTSKVHVYRDNYGRYSIIPLTSGEHKFSIGKTNESFFGDEESLDKQIYTGNIIPNIGNNPFEIIFWIQQNKKYKETNQKKLVDISNNTNEYFENIYFASEIECMTANMFFVAMCRRLGYKARVIFGISAYHKMNENTTFLSRNKGHAWSEVYINGKWEILDATPVKSDKTDNQNNAGDGIENMCSNAGQDAKNEGESGKNGNNGNNLEKINNPNYGQGQDVSSGVSHIVERILQNNNFDEITAKALKYVGNDALEIVKNLKNILEQRKQALLKARLAASSRGRVRKGLIDGHFDTSSDALQRASVGDPHIFLKRSNPSTAPEGNINTMPTSISLAIDISGSMGELGKDFTNLTKMTSAYLSICLLTLICKDLGIGLNVVLFSDSSFIINEQFLSESGELNPKFFNTIQETFKSSGGNKENATGVKDMLKFLENAKKGWGIILSDGDRGDNDFFPPNGESLEILDKNKGVIVTGLGLGDDASKVISINRGTTVSVIEAQLKTPTGQTKGYPLLDYKGVVKKLLELFAYISTASDIKLK